MVEETDVGIWADLSHKLTDPSLVALPIPPLIALLTALQEERGTDLSEAEVLSHRDNAVCMVVSLDVAATMTASRGYDDLDLRNVWSDWQAHLSALRG